MSDEREQLEHLFGPVFDIYSTNRVMTLSGFTMFVKDADLTSFHEENYETVCEFLGKTLSAKKFVKGLCLIGALSEAAYSRECAVRGTNAVVQFILTGG